MQLLLPSLTPRTEATARQKPVEVQPMSRRVTCRLIFAVEVLRPNSVAGPSGDASGARSGSKQRESSWPSCMVLLRIRTSKCRKSWCFRLCTLGLIFSRAPRALSRRSWRSWRNGTGRATGTRSVSTFRCL